MSYAHSYPIHRRWVIAAALSALRWARRDDPPQAAQTPAAARAQDIRRRQVRAQVDQERHAAHLRSLTVGRPVI